MTTNTHALDGADLVRYLFERFSAGDTTAAIGKWRADARWHPVTPVNLDGLDRPRSRDEYFGEVLSTAFSVLPGYSFEIVDVQAFDSLVVAHVRTGWDEGETRVGRSGLMVFRIVDGEVADLYSINGSGSGIW